MNILIAEDDIVNQMLSAELMENWGFNFDMASNGLEAVKYAQMNPEKYDLCLMDIKMPLMNGIEATRTIRQTVPYFPIMAFTASIENVQECVAVGMDEITEKPCEPSMLLSRIQELSVFTMSLRFFGCEVALERIKPSNSSELQELRFLRRKGLTKVKLLGLGHLLADEIVCECKDLVRYSGTIPKHSLSAKVSHAYPNIRA